MSSTTTRSTASAAATPATVVVRAIAAVVVALLVAACGASGGGNGDGRLSKREYIERADALQSAAASVFRTLDGKLPVTPKQAAPRLAALDELIAGYGRLAPPRDWRDEHDAIVSALGDMRHSLQVVSRASARNRRVIEVQVRRYQSAQRRYDDAVRSINATR